MHENANCFDLPKYVKQVPTKWKAVHYELLSYKADCASPLLVCIDGRIRKHYSLENFLCSGGTM